MLFLLDDLGLRSRPDLLATVLRNGLPRGGRDMVLIDIRASGTIDGRAAEETYSLRLDPGAADGKRSALALGSAGHAAALIDLLRSGTLSDEQMRNPVLVAHEQIIQNRFFADLLA